ncbi:MAG: S-layer homology domain-containing protein [Clostridia bacterium]|nr:S-layer homology domain-containing protein [Clostridia bacterium]
MKKLFSLLLTLTLVFSVCSFAHAASINLDSLQYDVYMRGETVTVYGTSDVYFTMGLYPPEESSLPAKLVIVYSPSALANGIEIELGDDESSWPDGTWTIVCQSGSARDEISFEIAETVDREEDETTSSSNKGNSSSSTITSTVTIISLEQTEITLAVGETAEIAITTEATSLSLEMDDESIVTASLSGKTLSVTGRKRGTAYVWVLGSSNYASLRVSVVAATEQVTEAPTDEETEEETEAATEEATEEATEAATEEATEEATVAVSFNDIETHWAKDDITYLASRGIVSGMSDGIFAPDQNVTRAQFVTMLNNAFSLPAYEGDAVFTDVPADSWYYSAVMAAYQAGIVKGSGDLFNPDSLVTRQDMAVFAYRAAQYKGLSADNPTGEAFDDDSDISDYAKDSVYAMRTLGIINGMTETTFSPLGNATRAQAATIIAKLYRLV